MWYLRSASSSSIVAQGKAALNIPVALICPSLLRRCEIVSALNSLAQVVSRCVLPSRSMTRGSCRSLKAQKCLSPRDSSEVEHGGAHSRKDQGFQAATRSQCSAAQASRQDWSVRGVCVQRADRLRGVSGISKHSILRNCKYPKGRTWRSMLGRNQGIAAGWKYAFRSHF